MTGTASMAFPDAQAAAGRNGFKAEMDALRERIAGGRLALVWPAATAGMEVSGG